MSPCGVSQWRHFLLYSETRSEQMCVLTALLLVDSVDYVFTVCAIFSGMWMYAVFLLQLSSWHIPKALPPVSAMALECQQIMILQNTSHMPFVHVLGGFLTFENLLYIWGGFLFGFALFQFWSSELCILNYTFPLCLLPRSHCLPSQCYSASPVTLCIILYSNIWRFIVHPIVVRFILKDLREITFSHSFIHCNILAKQLTHLWFLVERVDWEWSIERKPLEQNSLLCDTTFAIKSESNNVHTPSGNV